jgi:hypothetical protein
MQPPVSAATRKEESKEQANQRVLLMLLLALTWVSLRVVDRCAPAAASSGPVCWPEIRECCDSACASRGRQLPASISVVVVVVSCRGRRRPWANLVVAAVLVEEPAPLDVLAPSATVVVACQVVMAQVVTVHVVETV